MSTVRGQVAAQITADNPAYIVKAFPAEGSVEVPAKKVQVNVYREALTPDQNRLTHSLTVDVITGSGYSEVLEDQLEAALDQVLLSLERIPGIVWSTADRSVFGEKLNGYKIAVSCTSANFYKSIVRTEQEEVTP